MLMLLRLACVSLSEAGVKGSPLSCIRGLSWYFCGAAALVTSFRLAELKVCPGLGSSFFLRRESRLQSKLTSCYSSG